MREISSMRFFVFSSLVMFLHVYSLLQCEFDWCQSKKKRKRFLHRWNSKKKGMTILTFPLIRSIWLFWLPISFPISHAIFRRLPIIVLTCWRFSSISSSRASFVILQWSIDEKQKHVHLSLVGFYSPLNVARTRSHIALCNNLSRSWWIHLSIIISFESFTVCGAFLEIFRSEWNRWKTIVWYFFDRSPFPWKNTESTTFF